MHKHRGMTEEVEEFSNATEYINTFKLTIPEELSFIEEYDWSTLGSLADRRALFDMQLVQTQSAVNHAKYLYDLTKGDMSVSVKKWMTTLLKFFDIFEVRATKYCNSSNWRENFDIEKIAETKLEPIFNSDINKALGNLKKIVAKLRVDKDSNLDIEIKKGFTPSMAMYNVMVGKHPELVKFLEYKQKNKKKV